MKNVLLKIAPRIPDLLSQAAQGDITAIVLLGVAGIAFVGAAIEGK